MRKQINIEMYFAELLSTFNKTTDTDSIIFKTIKVGDISINIEYSNSQTHDLLYPALKHLETNDRHGKNLRIIVFGRASGSVKISFPEVDVVKDKLEYTFHYSSDGFSMNYYVHDKIISVINIKLGVAIYYIEDYSKLPVWAFATPFNDLFHVWLQQYDYSMLHAAVVGIGQNGVVIGGKSGSGKSTTAMSCLLSGMGYAGDDLCLLKYDRNPKVYSLYNSAKLREDMMERFGALRKCVENQDKLSGEKDVLYVLKHFPDRVIRQIDLKAIIVPKVSEDITPNLEKISSAKALAFIYPNTALRLSKINDSHQKIFIALSKLVRLLPCYNLYLNSDMTQAPKIIREYLSRMNSDGKN